MNATTIEVTCEAADWAADRLERTLLGADLDWCERKSQASDEADRILDNGGTVAELRGLARRYDESANASLLRLNTLPASRDLALQYAKAARLPAAALARLGADLDVSHTALGAGLLEHAQKARLAADSLRAEARAMEAAA